MKVLVVSAWAYNPHDLNGILAVLVKEKIQWVIISNKEFIEREYGAQRERESVPRWKVNTIVDFDESTIDSFVGLILSSGQKITRQSLYYDGKLLAIVRIFNEKNKPIAAPCGMVPILRNVLKNREATCHSSVAAILEDRGVRYVDRQLVIDGNIITVPTEECIPRMMEEFIKKVRENANNRAS